MNPRLLRDLAVLGIALFLAACDDRSRPADAKPSAAGHDHSAPAASASLADLRSLVRTNTDRLVQHIESAQLPAAADTARTLSVLGASAGEAAMADPRMPRKNTRELGAAGKLLADAAEALHQAAGAARADEARRLLPAVRAAADQLLAAVPDLWVCDMHCEPGKIYDQPVKCPVCRMALTKLWEMPYTVAVAAISPTLAPKQPVELRIDLIDPTGLKVEKLELVHEHPLHLITVSNDLSWFSHEHPTRHADGSFRQTLTFPHAGDFTVFADFTPAGSGQQSPSSALAIAGPPPERGTLVEDIDSVKQIDGYTLRMRCNGGPFYTGRDSLIRYGISRGEGGVETVTDLEPYLGAIGHLVIISEDLKSFIHGHPLDGGGHAPASESHAGHAHHGSDLLAQAAKFGNGTPHDPVFHVVFAKPGLYRAFAQFRHQGRIVTVPYTIDVRPEDGSPPPLAPVNSAFPSGHDPAHHGGMK